uniref:Zinc finger protein ZAT4 n=1 Tax=Cicer arietinum TaxID=3827 RepID=A0A1S3EKB7_CICAR|nr:zinc finger protein ZAT4 [Cicer arietinum]
MEKNKGRDCGICGKFFSSGKAIGGHMKSHLVILPIPPKPETMNQALDNSADLTQPPIQPTSSLTSLPEKKQTHDFRSMKRNFFTFSANSNRENEFVFIPKIPTRKRSKYCSKLNAVDNTKTQLEQTKSILDPVALVIAEILSTIKSKERNKQIINETNKMKAKDSAGSNDDSLVQAHSRARFICDMCGKMFGSYQALGGHKANHKKTKNPSQEGGYSDDEKSDNNGDFTDQKLFQCPYCYRAFKSAKAVGGHKKVHFPNTMVANARTSAIDFLGVR